jgi:CRISPR-associated protein (TIGR03986 family)
VQQRHSQGPRGTSRGPAGAPAPELPALTAPYAFVPHNDIVFEPEWADLVSQDVPFSDGVSGVIAIEIEAVTPLFVGAAKTREGTDREPAEKARYTFRGEPAIPSASLKGVIRSVVEAASLGRMGERIDDRRYSIRDLHNPRDYISHMTEDYGPKSLAGWLSLDPATGEWLLQPCDYSVVRQGDLEAFARNTHRRELFLGRSSPHGPRTKFPQSMIEKYKIWGNLPLEIRFDPDAWQVRDDWAKGRRLSRADSIGSGDTVGTIVFTGQPQDRWDDRARRARKDSKQVDFLFHRETGPCIAVPPRVREDFESVHRDPNTRQPNKEWDYWRQRMYKVALPEMKRRVPVFWLNDGSGAEPRIRAMGLSMMFRLAYRNSTRDLARQRGLGGGQPYSDPHAAPMDLADCLFGRVVPGEGPASLKGRIRFSHALRSAAGAVVDEAAVTAPMLAPKASFYPAYIAQRHVTGPAGRPQVPTGTAPDVGWNEGFPDYSTWHDERTCIRGRKRFPASTVLRKPHEPEPYNGKVMTRFVPLGRGTRFRAEIHVHNLRCGQFRRSESNSLCEELGALVWALTWGGRTETHAHMLGGAKPYGYGAARIRVLADGTELEPVRPGLEPLAGAAAVEFLARSAADFERMMDDRLKQARINARWNDSEQVRELLACADLALGDKAAESGRLAYMREPKQFQQIKARGTQLILPNHSGAPLPTEPVPRGTGMVMQPKGGSAAAKAAPKPPAKRYLLDGEPVELVSRSGDEMTVRYIDGGDIEVVSVGELARI